MALKFLGLFLLNLGNIVFCDRMVFEQWSLVYNVGVMRSLLGPAIPLNHPHECARHCWQNSDCSVFGFNHQYALCVLYGDVIIKNQDLENVMDGKQQYFVMREAWCPLQRRFMPFRRTGLCVWASQAPADHASAQTQCNSLSATLVALPSADKRDAMDLALNGMGSDYAVVNIGGSDAASEGVWVWPDGTPITDGWVTDPPNGGSAQNCLSLTGGLLEDVDCSSVDSPFICEIVN